MHLRPLASLDDFEACIALQRAIWGAEFDAMIPTSLLQASTHIGGLEWALRHGYRIAASHRDRAEWRAFYLVARDAQ